MRPREPFAEAWSLSGAQLVLPEWGSDPLGLRAVSTSPCTAACPAGIEVKTYVSLIAEERFDEALEVVRQRCPLPGVCGRVCTHPCEAACARAEHDDPVAIRALKRFVADRELDASPVDRSPEVERPERVAVIGSGPAGLTAAYDLRQRGYAVTVFEAESEPGGMLRHGIADYRLPPGVLSHEIDTILRTGIELRTGVRLGRDVELESILHGGYRAAVLAVGAQIGRRLGLPDEGRTEAIEDALAFLRRINAGRRERVGRKVLVIGGGSTAIEAARAALRVGAESSHLVYRRSRDQMPASHEEIEAAQSEGVQLTFLASPSRAVWNGEAFVGLEFLRAKLGEPDASGRPRPVLVPGSEFVMGADKVLAAIGQDIDLRFLPAQGRNRLSNGRRLHVDLASGATRLTGVFAAGDLMTGPSTVIEAIATGHRAADSVARFLQTGRIEPVPPPQPRPEHVEYELPDGAPASAARREPSLRPLDPERPFDEVEPCFEAADAVAEARRCLRCGPCEECRICAPSCHRRHLALGVAAEEKTLRAVVRAPSALTLALADLTAAHGALRVGPAGGDGKNAAPRSYDVEVRPLRAAVVSEECRACETCVRVCPFDAIRMVTSRSGRGQARIESALCRGCNLCISVCPTHAARPNVFSLDEWKREPARSPLPPKEMVLVCQQRLTTLDVRWEELPDRQILRLRCLGQIDSGLLLGLLQRGASRVVVAGCASDDCRYTNGSNLAADAFEQARGLLQDLGRDPDALLELWRDGEAAQPYEALVASPAPARAE